MKPKIKQAKFMMPASGAALALVNSAMDLGLPWWAVAIYCGTMLGYAAIEAAVDVGRMIADAIRGRRPQNSAPPAPPAQ